MRNRNRPEGVAGRTNASTRGHSFDELSKGLAEGTISRGRALKLIGASLLGGVGALSLFGGTAEARGRRRHHRRRRSGGCARGCFRGRNVNGNDVCVRNDFRCNNNNACDRNTDCGSNEACITNSGCRIGDFRGVCARQC
jgi:hypothetical protein